MNARLKFYIIILPTILIWFVGGFYLIQYEINHYNEKTVEEHQKREKEFRKYVEKHYKKRGVGNKVSDYEIEIIEDNIVSPL